MNRNSSEVANRRRAAFRERILQMPVRGDGLPAGSLKHYRRELPEEKSRELRKLLLESGSGAGCRAPGHTAGRQPTETEEE